jgi:hypothetical protein
VSTPTALSILTGIVSNFVASGCPVLIQPSKRVDPQEIIETLGASIHPGRDEYLRILWPKKLPALADKIVVRAGPSPSRAAVARLRKRYPGKLLLNVLAGNLSPGTDLEENEALFEDQISSARASDISFAFVGPSHKEQFEYYSALADVHLKLMMINDTLFLQPRLPSSTLYALQFEGNQITADAVV